MSFLTAKYTEGQLYCVIACVILQCILYYKVQVSFSGPEIEAALGTYRKVGRRLLKEDLGRKSDKDGERSVTMEFFNGKLQILGPL